MTDGLKSETTDIVNMLLLKNAKQRLKSAKEIQQHKYFENIDFSTIHEAPAPFKPEFFEEDQEDGSVEVDQITISESPFNEKFI